MNVIALIKQTQVHLVGRLLLVRMALDMDENVESKPKFSEKINSYQAVRGVYYTRVIEKEIL